MSDRAWDRDGVKDVLPGLRGRFPALRREVSGLPVAYFDGPGGTQVPTEVADAVYTYLLQHNANIGWDYPSSRETDAVLAAGRAAMADLFGARRDEISFGQNMTTITLRVSRALGRDLRPGDAVVVTELDHHANVDPWKALAAERGAEIRVARMDPATGTLDMDHLQGCLQGISTGDGGRGQGTGRPARILAIGAASNAIGTINDIPAAAEMAHEQGALVYVDAVHYAPHELIDVEDLGADFLVVSPYKFYGPHLGVLWGRRRLLQALDLPRVASSSDLAPERLETGTLSFEAISGATAAVNFLASVGDVKAGDARRDRLRTAFAMLQAHGKSLFKQLWDAMAHMDGVNVYGPPPDQLRTPTLGFSITGVDPARTASELGRRAVFVTHGDFYATTVVKRLGFGETGMLRAGCVAYTTSDEVDRLLEGVRDLKETAG